MKMVVHKLYEMTSWITNRHFFHFVEAYQHKFGEPTFYRTETLQNNFGAQFENIIYEWDNDISTIRIDRLYNDPKIMNIDYEHTRLRELLSRRLQQQKGDTSNTL